MTVDLRTLQPISIFRGTAATRREANHRMDLAMGGQPTIDTVLDRRATRPTHPGEQLTMHAGQLGLNHIYAVQHHHDLLVEADRARLVASISTRNRQRSGLVRAVRLQIGSALVRIGEQLQGAPPEPASELGGAMGALGPVR